VNELAASILGIWEALPPDVRAAIVFTGACLPISIYALIRLWRSHGRVLAKAAWMPVALVPLLGPIFCGAFYKPPSVQPEELRMKFDLSRHAGP
jgi:hypothetical protein